jgi:hypothetical protein
MLKGFVVVFTGFISYIYFSRRYTKLQFLGIGFVVLGLGLVGFSNVNSYNRHCILMLMISCTKSSFRKYFVFNRAILLGRNVCL